MITSRKLIWLLAIAASFLIVLTAGTSRPRIAQAAANDICRVDGPRIVSPGVPNLYAFRIEDDERDGIFGRLGLDHEVSIEIHQLTGVGNITAVVLEDERGSDEDPFLDVDGYKEINPGHLMRGVDSEPPSRVSEGLLDILNRKFGYSLVDANPCGSDGASTILRDCLYTIDEDTQKPFCDVFRKTTTEEQRDAWIEAVDEGMHNGTYRCAATDLMPIISPTDDGTLTKLGDRALVGSGYVNKTGRQEIMGWLKNYCDDVATMTTLVSKVVVDGVGFFVVTCEKPGTYEISITDDANPEYEQATGRDFPRKSAQFSVTCKSAPSKKSTIAHFPGVVEISPALGNVSHSLVLVTLWDEDGRVPASGYEVDFHTDRCSIETSGTDTPEELLVASSVFAAFNPVAPETAANIEASAAAMAAVDNDPRQDTMLSVDVGTPASSRAAAVLGCSADDAPGAKPGVATITAIIEVKDDFDIFLQVQVLVVGPPALVGVKAAPETVRCGEKATIQVTVLDELRQPVSNQTRVEAVTNMGGIFGGTGAVAGQAGPVVPVSSTVAQTYDGVAVFYLLTSELHTGPYEVVVATGGSGSVTDKLGGVFSTPPVVERTSVTCIGGAAIAAAVTAQAPPTSTAASPATATIRPPNTGDAGLLAVNQEASRWQALLIAGSIAMAATVCVARLLRNRA